MVRSFIFKNDSISKIHLTGYHGRLSFSSSSLNNDVTKFKEKIFELESIVGFQKVLKIFSLGTIFLKNFYNSSYHFLSLSDKNLSLGVREKFSYISSPLKFIHLSISNVFEYIRSSSLVLKLFGAINKIDDIILENTNAKSYGGSNHAVRVKKKENEKKMKMSFNGKINPNSDEMRIVIHKNYNHKLDSIKGQLWNTNLALWFKNFQMRIESSNNIFIHYFKKVNDYTSSKFSWILDENEMAKTIKEIKIHDPSFTSSQFIKDLYGFILPEVLENYINIVTIDGRKLFSDNLYTVITENTNERYRKGIIQSGKILDIRNVELQAAKLVDHKPILIFSMDVQQTYMFKNVKGKIIEGSDDSVQNMKYVIAFSKESDDSNAWKVIEIFSRKGSDW